MCVNGDNWKNFFQEKIQDGKKRFSILKEEKENMLKILRVAVNILSEFYSSKVNIVESKEMIGFSLAKGDQLIFELDLEERILISFIKDVEQRELKMEQDFIDFLNELFESYYFVKIMYS